MDDYCFELPNFKNRAIWVLKQFIDLPIDLLILITQFGSSFLLSWGNGYVAVFDSNHFQQNSNKNILMSYNNDYHLLSNKKWYKHLSYKVYYYPKTPLHICNCAYHKIPDLPYHAYTMYDAKTKNPIENIDCVLNPVVVTEYSDFLLRGELKFIAGLF